MSSPQPFYLASGSPRRQRMMRWLGIPFGVILSEVDERPHLDPGTAPPITATRLARAKAIAAMRSCPKQSWILAADTVVDLAGRALGKPADKAAARTMLRQLRAREHAVHTAIALVWPTGRIQERLVTAIVSMRPYTDAEIETYLDSGDPMDKAGAYAIQHHGFSPVDHVATCYANVVGFPLCAVVRLLRDAGWDIHLDIPALCAEHFSYRCPRPDEGISI